MKKEKVIDIKAYQKEWYQKNKEAVNKRQNEDVFCKNCYYSVQKKYMPAHLKTKKHIETVILNLTKNNI